MSALSVAERFWAKVSPEPNTGCWLWTASVNLHGYGKFGVGPRGRGHTGAHRVSWELHNGPIPKGLCVLHRCDNPPCVNPGHLFLGTLGDNNRDTARKGRMWMQQRKGILPDSLKRGHATLKARAAARPDPFCVTCGRRVIDRRTWKGRCHTCHEFFRRNGVDRGAAHFAGHGHRGELAGNAKLSEADVREIFRRVASGETQAALAAAFRVTKGHINNIVCGRTWSHLQLAAGLPLGVRS